MTTKHDCIVKRAGIACVLLTFSCKSIDSPAAHEVHRTALVFDGHNDLPWQVWKQANLSFDELDIALPQPQLQTDIPRLKKGGLGAQFWSVYVPADSDRPLHEVLQQIDLVERMAARYPETFEMAYTTADIERIHRSGRVASLIGIEGGNAIEDSLAILRMLYRAGARYMTLTHSDTLDWADSATDEPRSGGLSPFGEEVVRTMNQLGMLVDISHVSAETMRDVLRVSRAPVIASHSSIHAIAPHPRNIPDDVLEALAENGGVVMLNFFSGFVVPESARRMQAMFDVRRELRERYPDEAEAEAAYDRWRAENPIERGTLDDFLNHVDHAVRVAGVDHVGLGGDLDGVTLLPEGLEDVACYPLITRGLLDRGYAPRHVHKILGGNALRALREAEEVAKSLRSAGASRVGPGDCSPRPPTDPDVRD